MQELTIQYVNITDLIPAEYNPRAMTEAEAKQLATSLDSFGLVEPLVVNGAKERMNVIIGGHQRYNILKMMGEEKAPVVYVTIPDIEKEKELNLRLNKNSGHFDWDLLADIDIELLENVGFTPKEIIDNFGIDTYEDEVPAIAEKVVSEYGKVYELGKHRLMCGNACYVNDIVKLMGGGRGDYVIY